MKIEIETKYNLGDTLYYADPYWNIIKVTVKRIEVCKTEENETFVRYKLSSGEDTYEKYMENYFDTPEEAGQYFAQRAVENMKEK